jgi:predicted MFS family arabinose efflux permease
MTDTVPSPRLVALLALACGTIVGNIYYAQPLIGLIAPDLHLGTGAAGLIVTVTQLGYVIGLIAIASLADIVENRRLVLLCLVATIMGLLLVAAARGQPWFLAAACLVGVSTVSTQVLVPLAAHLSPDHLRGRTVGNVMGGLLAGIMLARPVSSMIASWFGWRAVFLIAAGVMSILALILRLELPRREPRSGLHYGQILFSMARILLTERVLQKRAAYQALMFAAFNLFWTAIPLLLADRFHLGQQGIALFALAGAGGALAAPIAGRLADRGLVPQTSVAAMAALASAFLLAAWAASAHQLIALVVAAIVLDAAVQANQICGQRAIYGLDPALRGRLTAVYVACMFIGGGAGSAFATMLYATGGFNLTALAGAATGAACLALFAATRDRSASTAPSVDRTIGRSTAGTE